jgi:hypothetical protein
MTTIELHIISIQTSELQDSPQCAFAQNSNIEYT